MKRVRPPPLATWLLNHLGGRYHREALLGDLLEEFRHGRSSAWYWRQVLLALGAAAGNALRHRLLGFSTLLLWWAFLVCLSPVWPSALIILMVDPVSNYLLFRTARERRQRKRSRAPCVP